MLRVCLLVAVAVAVGVAALPQTSCPLPPQSITCKNHCTISDSFGEYFCCDNKGSNWGSCPKFRLTTEERSHLCDVSQPGYPNHLKCNSDDECPVFQKCCFLPDNNQLICRNSLQE